MKSEPCSECAPLIYDSGQLDLRPAARTERALESLHAALEELTEALGYEEGFTLLHDELWAMRPSSVRPRRRRISKRIRRLVLERDEHACVECGSTTQLPVDHVIAVARGGPNHIENLRVLCARCNREKHAQ